MDNVFLYRGAIENLANIDFEHPLVFCGKKSFEKIKPIVEKYLKNPFYYNDFSPNPKIEDIERAVEGLDQHKFDIIIAIGGGSVIDFAKVFKHKAMQNLKLVAIPTTAGTGSETTQFAVYYKDGIKQSLDKPEVLPDIKIIDSQFVEDNPKYLKACCALDALCQGIESYFACKSTEESRNYAKTAIELAKDNIVDYVNNSNEENSLNMAKAAYYSGLAINISRTTASHAMSYSISAKYSIPHGAAVALTIGKLLEYNKNVDENTLNDKRGVDFVKSRMNEVYSILGITDANEYFLDLFEKIHIENIPVEVGYIDAARLSNNPRKLTPDFFE